MYVNDGSICWFVKEPFTFFLLRTSFGAYVVNNCGAEFIVKN